MSELDRVLADLNKRYKKPIISRGDEIKYPEIGRIPTGSLAIDLEIGGGIPCGKVTMIVANESAGKTTSACNIIVEAQKQGKRAVFIDVEGTFDAEWAKAIGVDLNKLMIAIPDIGEQAIDILEAVVRSKEAGVVILDSIAALMPTAEINKPMVEVDKEGEYESSPEQIGDRALMLNRAVRKLVCALNEINELGERNETAVVLINQFREKVNAQRGANPEVIPGGKGIKFVSSIILELRKLSGKDTWITEMQNGEEIKIGQTINFLTQKNKTFSPFRKGVTYLYFNGPMKGHFDKAREVQHYGTLLGLIKVEGQMTYLDDKKLRGEDNAIKYIRDNPKLQEKLEKEIRQVYLKGKDETTKKEK